MTNRFFVTLILIVSFCVAIPTVAVAQIVPNGAPDSFADLADNVTKAVVNISTTQIFEPQEGMQNPYVPFPEFPPGSPFQDFFEDFFNAPFPPMDQPSQRSQSLGSGFIVDAQNGYIVTNSHVIDQADEIQVTLYDDTMLDAEVVGRDSKTDLAVLKVTPKDAKLEDVQWGDSQNMRVGDWILAVGNPFGLGGTVTAGIISARQRNINAGPYDDFIQTDASINRGNSGGPMFNMAGKVIGINTAIFSPTGGSVGIGFAIPSELARPIIQQLIKYGQTRRGWLGVRIQTVTDEIAENLGLEHAKGALVASITPNGPADKAGLKTGDVIIGFNGEDIEQMRNLPRIVADTEIGTNADVTVWRQGKTLQTKVKVGQLEKAEKDGLLARKAGTATPKDSGTGNEIDLLDLTVVPLTEPVRQRFAISDDVNGVVVLDIGQTSDAVEKGLIPGDVIVEINQEKVKNVDDFNKKLNQAKKEGKTSVLLLVNSRSNMRFVAVKIAENE